MDTVATLADLRAYSGSSDALHLLGYYEPGDGADGLYVWREGDEDADNGGTCLESSERTGGRWIRARSWALDVRWFGARGDGVTDDSPAFTAAIGALGEEGTCTGGRLLVPPGVYRLASDLVIDRVMVLSGAAGTRNYGSAQLRFDDGHGVLIQEIDPENGAGRNGSHAVLEHLYLLSAGDGLPVGSRPESHGIRARAAVHLRHCFVVGFNGHGVWIDSAGDWPNCNGWSADRVTVENCTGWGWMISGGNSQGAGTTFCSGMSNGLGHLWDSSFLGNTHVGFAAEAPLYGPGAREDDPSLPRAQGIKVDGAVNRTALIGGYVEEDCAPSEIGPVAVALGGCHGAGFAPGSTGLRILDKDTVSGFQVAGAGAPAVQIGRNGNALSIQADGDDGDLQIAYGRTYAGWYEVTRAGQVVLAISGSAAAVGAGKLMLPSGVLLGGPGAYPVRVSFGRRLPEGPAGEGDIIIASDPVEAGTEGWRCTHSGYSAPRWQPGAAYDAGNAVTPDPDYDRLAYRCVQAGSSGSTPPTWPTTEGATVTDGGCIWECMPGRSAGWRAM